jgi:hypothetical protein
MAGNLLSIQGEQQARQHTAVWADQSAVEDYAEKADEKTLVCRSRGRHFYSQINKTERIHFEGVTPEGFVIRRALCLVCERVTRVEAWDIRHRRDKITRLELVYSYSEYKSGYLGKKGQGRMKPKQIASAVGTIAMYDMSYREVRQEAVEAQKRSRDAG